MTSAASPPFSPLAEDATSEARRQRNMQRWKRRSRQIHFFRRAPARSAIGVILVSLAGWVLLRGFLTRLGDLRSATSTIHMTNARFFGRDENGRPYVLGATEATRSDKDFQRITLHRIQLTFDSGGANQNKAIFPPTTAFIARMIGYCVFATMSSCRIRPATCSTLTRRWSIRSTIQSRAAIMSRASARWAR